MRGRRVDPAIDRRLLARVEAAQRRLPGTGDARLEFAVAAFRAALIRDIRQHRLAWSVIVAGALASAMLWASIAGLPLARPAEFDLPAALPGAPPAAADVAG